MSDTIIKVYMYPHEDVARLQSELTAARDEAERLRGQLSEMENNVLAALGHYPTESPRCRARYKDVVTTTEGPKNPPIFCVLGAGHDGPHHGQHGAKMRDKLIEFGPAISVCAKCRVRWPCPDAEKVLKADELEKSGGTHD